jgi:predicted dehydrogenase
MVTTTYHKDFVLLGGNFSSKVIKPCLNNFLNKVHHIDTSKKFISSQYFNSNIFFVAIPPEKNILFFKDSRISNSRVFIEKPFTVSLNESFVIKEICLKRNISIFVDFTFNFLDSFCFFLNLLKDETVVKYNFLWRTKTLQKNFKNNWKHNRLKGGGGLNNYLSHIISVILLNFGNISILKANLFHNHIGKFIFDDYKGYISFVHENNINGILDFSIISDENPILSLEVITSSNIYKIETKDNNFFRNIFIYKNNKKIFYESNNQEGDSRLNGVNNAIKSFLNDDDSLIKVNLSHALQVTKVLDLIWKSSSKNKELYAYNKY